MDERKYDQPASFCLLPCLRCHEDSVPLEPHTKIKSFFVTLLLFVVSYHSLRKETYMVGFFFSTIIPDCSGPGRLRDVSIGLLSTAFRNYGFDFETTIPKLEPLWSLLPQCDLSHTSISEEEDGE